MHSCEAPRRASHNVTVHRFSRASVVPLALTPQGSAALDTKLSASTRSHGSRMHRAYSTCRRADEPSANSCCCSRAMSGSASQVVRLAEALAQSGAYRVTVAQPQRTARQVISPQGAQNAPGPHGAARLRGPLCIALPPRSPSCRAAHAASFANASVNANVPPCAATARLLWPVGLTSFDRQHHNCALPNRERPTRTGCR